jgi:hypothetical protein
VVDGVDAIVFTHGSDGGDKGGAERVDYGGVRSVLAALHGRSVRISLMTAIGVTNREGDYNRQTEAHDWKRRGERLGAPAGCRTPSCGPADSTTTSQTNSDSYSYRAIAAMRATQRRGHRAAPTRRGLGRQSYV